MIVEWWENGTVTYMPIRILYIDGVPIPSALVVPQTVENPREGDPPFTHVKVINGSWCEFISVNGRYISSNFTFIQ